MSAQRMADGEGLRDLMIHVVWRALTVSHLRSLAAQALEEGAVRVIGVGCSQLSATGMRRIHVASLKQHTHEAQVGFRRRPARPCKWVRNKTCRAQFVALRGIQQHPPHLAHLHFLRFLPTRPSAHRPHGRPPSSTIRKMRSTELETETDDMPSGTQKSKQAEIEHEISLQGPDSARRATACLQGKPLPSSAPAELSASELPCTSLSFLLLHVPGP